MIAVPEQYEPEKYSDYRNRVFTRHKNKAENMLIQINQCSLRKHDKVKIVQELIEILKQQ